MTVCEQCKKNIYQVPHHRYKIGNKYKILCYECDNIIKKKILKTYVPDLYDIRSYRPVTIHNNESGEIYFYNSRFEKTPSIEGYILGDSGILITKTKDDLPSNRSDSERTITTFTGNDIATCYLTGRPQGCSGIVNMKTVSGDIVLKERDVSYLKLDVVKGPVVTYIKLIEK